MRKAEITHVQSETELTGREVGIDWIDRLRDQLTEGIAAANLGGNEHG